jgi:hypothetical protein
VKAILAVAVYLCFVIALGVVTAVTAGRETCEIDGADDEL